VLPARVRAVLGREGHQVTVLLSLGEGGGGARLLARISARSYDVLGLAEGDAVFAQVKGVALA